MRHSLFPAGGQNTSLLTVKNTRSKPLPVEIIVEKRIYGEDSVQTFVPADEDFVIFPFQALIEPGASQAFRFQYIGDPVLQEETAYSIHVREVPVDLEDGFTGLRYIYSFGVAVYIENRETESNLAIGPVSRDGDLLSFVVENSGKSFGRLANDQIIVTQGETNIVLEGEALMNAIDGVVVPPNNSLPVQMTLDDLNLTGGDVNITLRETPD